MNRNDLDFALRDIRSLVRLPGEDCLSDDELVRRFADARDEAAFAALVRRYGPTVLRICNRVLHHSHDAEEVFQATFLVLSREAGSLRHRGAVGPWISEVAYHAALRLWQQRARQRHHEERHVPPMNDDDPSDSVLREDVQAALYDELQRLPEKYRGPLVLCNLLNRTQEQAACELGLQRSALGKRLKRAYSLLRQRLKGRGISLSVALLASLLHDEGRAAPLPPDLLLRTVRAATGTIPSSVGTLPPPPLPLPSGLWVKSRTVLLVAVLLVAGGFSAVLAWKTPPRDHAGQPPTAAPSARPMRAVHMPWPVGECIDLEGTVLAADGRPLPGAQVAVCGLRSFRPGKRNVRDEMLARGQTDGGGHFRLRVPRPPSTWSLRTAFVHLWAAAPGHAPVTSRLSWRPNASPVEVRLARPETIRGRLLDEDGQPAARVCLLVSRIGDIRLEPIQIPNRASQKGPPLWPAPVITDAAGRFALSGLNLAPGIGLRVCDDRFVLRRVALEPSRWSGREVTLRLAPPRLLAGRVTAEDGTAQPGARLHVLALDATGRIMGSALDARTNAAGGFHVRLPAADRYRVEAFAREDSPHLGIAREVAWPADARRQHLQLTLPRGILLRGVVRDADGGKPVPQAHIQFRPRDKTAIPSTILTGLHSPTLTGADGTFRLTVPRADGLLLVHEPSGEYVTEEWSGRLRGFAGRVYAQRVLALALASGPEVRDLALRLRRGVTIRGRVLDSDGEPVARGAWLCRSRTCPGAADEGQPQPFWDGCFTLRGCVPGRLYPVLFLAPHRRLGVRTELLAGGADKPVDVRLQRCGTATARFLNERGRPVAGHQPFLYLMVPPDRAGEDEDGTDPAPAEMHELDEFDPGHYRNGPRTDADGRVTLPALIPGVRYRMNNYLDDDGGWREFETTPGQTLSLPNLVVPGRH